MSCETLRKSLPWRREMGEEDMDLLSIKAGPRPFV
jgi:hypothetical protein